MTTRILTRRPMKMSSQIHAAASLTLMSELHVPI
jgi:hypothetical protein